MEAHVLSDDLSFFCNMYSLETVKLNERRARIPLNLPKAPVLATMALIGRGNWLPKTFRTV